VSVAPPADTQYAQPNADAFSLADRPAAAAAAVSALTPEQSQAVARRRGSLLLAAGAGSGKTAVLVERFVCAVREDGVAPARILVLTFTERAAAELRERVRARLLEVGEREAARDTEGALIGTFHGFCARLLRTHALSAGLDPDFAILDEVAAGRPRQLAFRRALAALLDEGGQPGRRNQAVELLAAYGADRVRRMVVDVHAEQRSRGVTLPTLPDPALSARSPSPAPAGESVCSAGQANASTVTDDPTEATASTVPPDPAEAAAVSACVLLGVVLEEYGRAYAALKRARSALDFDDLELCALELLKRDAGVRRAWAQRLELLMVDEFQDTNRRQLALLGLLERGNLFTVGDELQSIYGFRHAEVAIFRERRRELEGEGRALALVRNFRGRPPLLAAVNAVFGERFGDAYAPLLAARKEGHEDGPLIELLLTDRGAWSEGGRLGGRTSEGELFARRIAGTLPPAAPWRHAEARLLAQRVADLVAGGQAAPGDVAVLLRAAGDLPVYERALEERGLRTLAAVGTFWGHQQVGDLLAWLRALANPLDEVALYSVLASPLVGLSSDGLALLALHARAVGVGAWAALSAADGEARELYARLPALDGERLESFAERFAAERRCAPACPLAELLLRAVAHNGYERHVRSLAWGERRLANVHKLLRLARRFEAAEGRDLRGFLDHVAHALAQAAEPHAPVGSEPDAVRLMTVHAAKGLEFPVVCLADLGRAVGGAPPDLLVDGERVGLRLVYLDGSPSVGCLRYEELWAKRRRAQDAEEERILYVAMTRARERLLVSGACDFARWPAAASPGGCGCAPPVTERAGGTGTGADPGAGAGARAAGGAPIDWLAPALMPELPTLVRTLERAVLEHPLAGANGSRIRCWLNAPSTVGEVLRADSPGAAMLVA
jgi:ATP-dependent helicase/nuclease subunit A